MATEDYTTRLLDIFPHIFEATARIARINRSYL